MSDLIFFNSSDGFSEAFLRGLRKTILSESNYGILSSTHNLRDLKTALLDTDYAEFVKEYNEQDTTSLKIMLKRKLSDEVDYLQMVAGPELQKFIQMIRHKYMIDNVINIIEGTKNKTAKEIIQGRSEPLGYLPEISGLINLNIIDELYEDVLIDTEVGYYFSALLEETLLNSDDKKFNAIQYYLQELKPENLKNYLKKIWLEHFYLYCQTLNDTTREIMEDILKFEADCQALQIIYNSLSFQGFSQEEERKKVIPNFVHLYPAVTDRLIKEAKSMESLLVCLENFPVYRKMFDEVPDPKKLEEFNIQSGIKTLDDVMFKKLTEKYCVAFENQFHYAGFYSYIKIKEQEIKNIIWLAELVALGDKENSAKLKKNIIIPFKHYFEAPQ